MRRAGPIDRAPALLPRVAGDPGNAAAAARRWRRRCRPERAVRRLGERRASCPTGPPESQRADAEWWCAAPRAVPGRAPIDTPQPVVDEGAACASSPRRVCRPAPCGHALRNGPPVRRPRAGSRSGTPRAWPLSLARPEGRLRRLPSIGGRRRLPWRTLPLRSATVVPARRNSPRRRHSRRAQRTAERR